MNCLVSPILFNKNKFIPPVLPEKEKLSYLFFKTAGIKWLDKISQNNGILDVAGITSESVIELPHVDLFDARSHVGNSFGKPEIFHPGWYYIWSYYTGGTNYWTYRTFMLTDKFFHGFCILTDYNSDYTPIYFSNVYSRNLIAVYNYLTDRNAVYSEFNSDTNFIDIFKNKHLHVSFNFQDLNTTLSDSYILAGGTLDTQAVKFVVNLAISNPELISVPEATGGFPARLDTSGSSGIVFNNDKIVIDTFYKDPYIAFKFKISLTGRYHWWYQQRTGASTSRDFQLIVVNTNKIYFGIWHQDVTNYNVQSDTILANTIYEGYAKYDRLNGKLILSVSEDGEDPVIYETLNIPDITFSHTATEGEIGNATSWPNSYWAIGELYYLIIGDAARLPYPQTAILDNNATIIDNNKTIVL